MDQPAPRLVLPGTELPAPPGAVLRRWRMQSARDDPGDLAGAHLPCEIAAVRECRSTKACRETRVAGQLPDPGHERLQAIGRAEEGVFAVLQHFPHVGRIAG